MRKWLGVLFVWSLAGSPLVPPDLGPVRAEPNLEKRSQLALANAEAVYKTARTAYDNGENEQTQAAVNEILESVELAHTSLVQTGKDPRRSPKWFKKAELQTRDLVRKIESFQEQMSFNDRPMLDKLKARTQQIHDELLLGLMEGKKKK
jgi:DNA repair ATPase RecN